MIPIEIANNIADYINKLIDQRTELEKYFATFNNSKLMPQVFSSNQIAKAILVANEYLASKKNDIFFNDEEEFKKRIFNALYLTILENQSHAADNKAVIDNICNDLKEYKITSTLHPSSPVFSQATPRSNLCTGQSDLSIQNHNNPPRWRSFADILSGRLIQNYDNTPRWPSFMDTALSLVRSKLGY